MNVRNLSLAGIAIAMLGSSAAGQGMFLEEPWGRTKADRDYAEKFGREHEQVGTTPDKADDVAFAKKLLKAAESYDKRPEFQGVILVSAGRFARQHPSGIETALKIAELYRKVQPQHPFEAESMVMLALQVAADSSKGDKRIEVSQKLMRQQVVMADLYVTMGQTRKARELYGKAAASAKQFDAQLAEKIRPRHQMLLEIKRLEGKADELAKKIKADPKDKATRLELARLYLIHLARPEPAADLNNKSLPEDWQESLYWVAREPVQLAPVVLLQLTDWFQKQADAAPDLQARIVLLVRAETYAKTLLTDKPLSEDQKAQATSRADKITKALAKLTEQEEFLASWARGRFDRGEEPTEEEDDDGGAIQIPFGGALAPVPLGR